MNENIMDAIDWLNEIITNPNGWRMFYSESEIKSCAEAALAILKKQEARDQEEEKKRAIEQLEAIGQMPADSLEKVDEDEADDEMFEKASAMHSTREGNTLILILLAVNLLLSGFFLYRSITAENAVRNGQISLSVGEETFVIPTSAVPRTGETTITFYGISTTNNNGQISRQAIPVGEIRIGE